MKREPGLLKKYKKYREKGKKLNSKMIGHCLGREHIMASARLPGMVRGDAIEIEDEAETDLFFDLALNDLRKDGRKVTEICRETAGVADDIEKEIFDALGSAYTSLFKIVSVSRPGCRISLHDLLNDRDDVELTDIGLSLTARKGMLLFTRIVPFEGFNMTSGVSFAFPWDQEKRILRSFRYHYARVKSDDDAVRRFVAFNKVNRKFGMGIVMI